MKKRPISQRSYEVYKREYKKFSSHQPMATEMFDFDEFKNIFSEIRTHREIKNPSYFIARGQRKYSTSQQRATQRFARTEWDELKKIEITFEYNGKEEKTTALNIFKERFGIKSKRKLTSEFVLNNRQELIDFLYEQLGYNHDDVDEIFSPKES